jgi:hypothetical protein
MRVARPRSPLGLKTKLSSGKSQTLGGHLKKRRRQLALLQWEAAERMGIGTDTYANWEKGKMELVASQFGLVVTFTGYDPMAPRPRRFQGA